MERLLDSIISTDRMVGGAAGEVDERRGWKVIWCLTIVPCHPEVPISIYIITHRWDAGCIDREAGMDGGVKVRVEHLCSAPLRPRGSASKHSSYMWEAGCLLLTMSERVDYLLGRNLPCTSKIDISERSCSVTDGGHRKRSKVYQMAFTGFYEESTLQENSYINFGCLAESSHRVHVVIENDDPHHHPHAEHECLLACKPAPVLPEREDTDVASLPYSNTCILRPTTGHSSTRPSLTELTHDLQ